MPSEGDGVWTGQHCWCTTGAAACPPRGTTVTNEGGGSGSRRRSLVWKRFCRGSKRLVPAAESQEPPLPRPRTHTRQPYLACLLVSGKLVNHPVIVGKILHQDRWDLGEVRGAPGPWKGQEEKSAGIVAACQCHHRLSFTFLFLLLMNYDSL